MNMIFRAAILSLSCLSVQAMVVVGTDHVRQTPGSNQILIDQEFAVSGMEVERDFTGFGFTQTTGNSYNFDGSFLDEGVSVYLIGPSSVFSEATLGSFTELVFDDVYNLGSSFILGMRTPAIGEPADFSQDYGYGWASFTSDPNNGELTLVGHAVAYGPQGSGIISQSQTAVPEPSTGLLSLLALGVCFRRRR